MNKFSTVPKVSVQDEGRGIPEHLLPSIFDRFTQVKSSDARTKGGSGLGLSICKALVELHGGIISATSIENQGSTFSFTVPLPGCVGLHSLPRSRE
jgi:signal transduction histidine kinase